MRLALLAAALVLLVACDGGEGDATATATASATGTASSTATGTSGALPVSTPRRPPSENPTHVHDEGPPRAAPFVESAPEPRRTGIPHLDAVLEVIEAGRADLLRDLLAIEIEACVSQSQAQGGLFLGPPACEADEAPGTPVETFHVGWGCSGGYSRPYPDVLAQWIEATHGLYAAVPAGSEPDGAVRLVFHGGRELQIVSPFVVVDADGRIIGLYLGGCATVEDRTQGNGERMPLVAGPWLDPLGAPPAPVAGIEALDRVLSAIHRRSQDAWSAYTEEPWLLHSCWPFGLHGVGLFNAQPVLAAVYEAPSQSPDRWEQARWWLAYEVQDNEGRVGSARIGVTEAGRIVGVHYHCDPAEVIATWGEEHLVVLGVGEADTPRRSGIPDVDAILDEVEAGDATALHSRVRLYEVGCTHRQGLGGPPKCEGEDAEGTVYERFPVAGCSHGRWAEDAEGAISGALASDGLVAVLEGGVTWSEFPDLVTEYGLVYRPAGDSPTFVVVGVTDSAIVSVEYRCGGPYRDSDRIVAGPWGAED